MQAFLPLSGPYLAQLELSSSADSLTSLGDDGSWWDRPVSPLLEVHHPLLMVYGG